MDWASLIADDLLKAVLLLLDGFMALVTLAAPFALVAYILHLVRSGAKSFAWELVIVLFVTLVVSVELQWVFMRPRPIATGFLPAPPTPGFPSGHAALAGAFAMYGTLKRFNARIFWGIALIVMISRVWLGHHYPSDVIFGAALGSSMTAVGIRQSELGERPSWAWWLWPQLYLVAVGSFAAYLKILSLDFLHYPGVDKVLHFLLFGTLSFFSVGWLSRYRPIYVVLSLAGLSALDEFMQSVSPQRSFDLVDLACTLSGVVLFGVSAAVVLRKRNGADADQRGTHHAASGSLLI